jgi:hypothetical protein
VGHAHVAELDPDLDVLPGLEISLARPCEH